jgi:dTDP-4-amino-4,6-dideoxygalactose transaminase
MAGRAVLGTWFTSVLEESVHSRYGGYVPGSCPRAEEAARHLVNLPTHGRVDERDAEEIAARIISAEPGEAGANVKPDTPPQAICR